MTPPPRHQVSLVLELCDMGTLRDALDAGAFRLGAPPSAPSPSRRRAHCERADAHTREHAHARTHTHTHTNARAHTRSRTRTRTLSHTHIASPPPDDGQLNYCAVLDTAIDIARALLHLHKQQARGFGVAIGQ